MCSGLRATDMSSRYRTSNDIGSELCRPNDMSSRDICGFVMGRYNQMYIFADMSGRFDTRLQYRKVYRFIMPGWLHTIGYDMFEIYVPRWIHRTG